MLQPHAVQYGTGDFEPPDSPEPATPSTVRFPAFLWTRDRNGSIQSISFEEAREKVKPTHYFPWHWLGLLECRQVIPLQDCFLAQDVRTLEGIDDTSLDRWHELCAFDRAEQSFAYAG